MSTSFAIVRRLLAFEFVEECELSAGDMLHLLSKTAHVIELASGRNVTIPVLRHGFCNTEKIAFSEFQCVANAVSHARRHVAQKRPLRLLCRRSRIGLRLGRTNRYAGQ